MPGGLPASPVSRQPHKSGWTARVHQMYFEIHSNPTIQRNFKAFFGKPTPAAAKRIELVSVDVKQMNQGSNNA